MAAKAGWQVDVVTEGDEFHIQMAKGEIVSQTQPLAVGTPVKGMVEAISGPLVLFVSSDIMGRGEAELGNILVRAFFHTLGEVAPLPQQIIFVNTGVKLACEESPVLEDLQALEAQDIEMLVCGTCLGYFELKEKLAVGQVSNMYDIAEMMLNAGKVVNL
jgi:selenium metabolism protein YedF